MSKPWLKLVVLAFAFVAAGCSADADADAARIEFWKVGAACIAGAAPADPEWCSGSAWKCVPEGQCLPKAACATNLDCGCGARGMCDAVCVEGRCLHECFYKSDCAGTSRCVVKKVDSYPPEVQVCE